MHRWFTLLSILAVLLCAVSATAKETPKVTPYQQAIVTPAGPGIDRPQHVEACVVGNLNPGAWVIGDWLLPPEGYKLAFDPYEGCGNCANGFQIEQVHILLQTSAACDMVMYVDLEDAIFPEPDCPFPGPVDCESDLFNVSLPSAGVWDVVLPMACPCAYMDYTYFLSVHFLDISCVDGTVPDLITDNFPSLCTSYNDFGFGWLDLVFEYGFPGNLLIWADAVCCENPVGVDTESVGRLKKTFQD